MKNLCLSALLLIFVCLFYASPEALGATWTVSSTADTPFGQPCKGTTGCSLRQAYTSAAAVTGQNTIIIEPGTYLLLSSISFGGDIILQRSITPGQVNIDGNSKTSLFNVTENATFNGIRFINGRQPEGPGGAIVFVNDGFMTINNCEFVDNKASIDRGGAIYFESNSGIVSIFESTFSGNMARDGGALYNESNATINIYRCTFDGNIAGFTAGAIDNRTGTINITTSTISGNSVTDEKGFAGAVFNEAGTVNISQSTVAYNSAADVGGLLAIGAITVDNSIIAANIAPGPGRDVAVNFVSNGYNLIGTYTPPLLAPLATGDIYNVDPQLMPLAYNGGVNFTHALRANSPAIDAGNAPLTTDQRRLPRPVDLPGYPSSSGGNTSDIGAYEAQSVPTAARIGVAGRVLDIHGRALGKAIVIMSDSNGNVRTVMTNGFGFYSFEDVEAGRFYIFNVSAKGQTYAPYIWNALDAADDLNFMPQSTNSRKR